MKDLYKSIKKNQFQDNMLDLFRKEFNDILTVASTRRKNLLLANLMTQIEHYYNIPATKVLFEREIAADVKELYLAVSNARSFKA